MTPSASHNNKTVVIYRMGSLGDTLVSLPVFHAIARATPGARRVALTNFPVSSKAAALETILGGSGLIDDAVAYPVGTRSLGELWKLRAQLRSLGADTLYYLTAPKGGLGVWRDYLFFKLCGFKHVIGTPLTEDLRNWRELPDGTLEPECERLARCFSGLEKIDLKNPADWSLHLTAQERSRGEAIASPLAAAPYMAINMGGKVVEKDWGEANWISLLKRVSEREPGMGLLVVGAQEDSERATRVAAAWSGAWVDACGKLSPRETAAAVAGARVFVGHDSGPMHLAASVGVPCIGLFGNYNRPKSWHPYGDHHLPIHDMRGVQAIEVDEVEARVNAVLASALTDALHERRG